MEQFEITINGKKVLADASKTILDVAKENNIKIPTLCFLKDINEVSSCRVCVVEVEGARNLVTACSAKCAPNMVIKTNSEKVLKSRKTTVELLLSNHNKNCLSCPKNLNCELQKLSKDLGCDADEFKGEMPKYALDTSSKCIIRDNSKCILCGRCVAVCEKRQGVSAISKDHRGFVTQIGCAFENPITQSSCIGCGQCTLVCPTGALMEKNDVNMKIKYLNDPEIETVVQVAPSVRVALAEEFGNEIGTFTEKKMATALHMLGFDHVYDVNNGADFTIVEESKELIDRLTKKTGPLPMFTSCCPAWYKYVIDNEPKMIDNLSTCKSPNEMLGAIVKYKLAKETKKQIKVISIMPCTAKKMEIARDGIIDISLTTRELAELIKKQGIKYNSLPDGEFDKPFGEYSGAALLFGATGGVMEAALRTAIETIENKTYDVTPTFEVVRNSPGRKEAEIKAGDLTLRVAIVNGLANAKKLLADIKSGKTTLDFIEVMACPGGCVNGGGQPYVDYNETELKDVIKKRSQSIYKVDEKMANRQSHKNSELKDIYKNLFKGDEHLIHELLHVSKEHMKNLK